MKMKNGMVVTPQPEAAEAGAAVLERGGNAIDAAIACAFMQGVVDPMMAGIGGFGSIQVYMPSKGVHEVIEFYARAPLAVTPDMWEGKMLGQSRDGFAFLLQDHLNEFGHLAVCTPGSVKGYEYALSRYGTMDWKDAIAPAIAQARRGFMVRPHVHWFWSQDQAGSGQINTADKLRYSEAGKKLYFRADGTLKRPGDMVVNTDMADTLQRLANAGGSDIFYHGEIAQAIGADMKAHGGLITFEDLDQYELSVTQPLWGSYRGRRIATSPPPASGMAMLEVLHIMENFDVAALRHSGTDHVRLLAEAMKYMTIDKDQFLGDPEYVDVPVERLMSKPYAAELAARIRNGERAKVQRLEEPTSRDTTQISVVDQHGNAVSMTHTLGSPSGAIAEGMGFMYNGTISRFDPRPGRAASLAPGKRRSASQAPTIVFEGDQPRIVIGAPGGSYIAPALAQGIMNVIDFGMSMSDAVAAPRIVAVSDSIDVSNRIALRVTDELTTMGYDVKRSPQSYAFAALHGIAIDKDSCSGGADPQRDGLAVSVPAHSGSDTAKDAAP
jgi:gamma-glutamyltranspeptidase / glutathione hydrolase